MKPKIIRAFFSLSIRVARHRFTLGAGRGWLSAAGAALLLVFAPGCAGPRTALKPEDVGKVNRTRVRSFIPQNELKAEFIQSGYGEGFGLIGLIIDASVTSGRKHNAEERVQRLREQVRDVDVRTMYWQAISNVVCQTPWLKVEKFETSFSDVGRVTAAMVDQAAALQIGTDYYLSQDCRVLVLSTGIRLHLPGKHRAPAAVNVMAYNSAEVGAPDGDRAIPLWTAEGAKAFRRAAAEAVQQSAQLLHYALDYMGGVSSGDRRPAKIRAKLMHARGDFGIAAGRVGLKVTVLEETADRIIVQTKYGNLFSLPRNEIEVEYLPLK